MHNETKKRLKIKPAHIIFVSDAVNLSKCKVLVYFRISFEFDFDSVEMQSYPTHEERGVGFREMEIIEMHKNLGENSYI